jgi:hypothetical protein
MADFPPWVQNWSSLVADIGIIGSLYFTAAYFRSDSRNRYASNLQAYADRHKALWSEVLQRKELNRLLLNEADIKAEPPTLVESKFAEIIMLHFETGWETARAGDRKRLKGLALDATQFFSRPLPRAVWKESKKYHDPGFVQFVERALEQSGRLRPDS